MPDKTEETHPEIAQLVTGRFRETAGYEAWRARGTDDWLLIATLGGGGRFGGEGAQFTAAPGDLVLLRPGTRHDYGVAPGAPFWELLWTHFHPRPDWAPWLLWPEAAPGLSRLTLTDPDLRGRVFARFAQAHDLAIGALRHRETFAMNALEEVLLLCDLGNPRARPARLDPRVEAALGFLCRRLAEPVGLDDLAAHAGLSVSRLARLFRQEVGLTPQQYLEGQRLHRARQLLELTARPVAAVAAEVGYENPFYFTLRFKRSTGLSPRDYRRKHGGGSFSGSPGEKGK